MIWRAAARDVLEGDEEFLRTEANVMRKCRRAGFYVEIIREPDGCWTYELHPIGDGSRQRGGRGPSKENERGPERDGPEPLSSDGKRKSSNLNPREYTAMPYLETAEDVLKVTYAEARRMARRERQRLYRKYARRNPRRNAHGQPFPDWRPRRKGEWERDVALERSGGVTM